MELSDILVGLAVIAIIALSVLIWRIKHVAGVYSPAKNPAKTITVAVTETGDLQVTNSSEGSMKFVSAGLMSWTATKPTLIGDVKFALDINLLDSNLVMTADVPGIAVESDILIKKP